MLVTYLLDKMPPRLRLHDGCLYLNTGLGANILVAPRSLIRGRLYNKSLYIKFRLTFDIYAHLQQYKQM